MSQSGVFSLLPKPVKILLGIAGLTALIGFIFAIRGLLAPFGLAFVMAYILSPLVNRLEGQGLPRVLSILVIFLAMFGVLAVVVVKAGGTVTEQIVRLSDRILLREMVAREVVLENRGEQILAIRLDWEDHRAEQSFAIVQPEAEVIELNPGEKRVVGLRFSPQALLPADNTLLLSSPILAQPLKVPVRGNAGTGEKGAEVQQSWRENEREEEIRVYDLVISPAEIDFGRAGPNLISSLSETVAQLQPFVQPYLGDDFDIAQLVRVQGRSLIDVRFLGSATGILGGVFSGLTFIVLVPFIAFFFLKEGRRITLKVIELAPNAYFELCLNLLSQINAQIGGYIRGQLLAVSVVAFLGVSGLLLIGLEEYAVPLGLLAGFANMIPFLGPLIGIVSASIVALATGGGLGMVGKVVILFLIVQLIDNLFIQPIVVARSVEMHPLMVLFVVMVGSQLIGLVGMLIAVPLFGILKVTVQTIYVGIKEYRT